jgi:hypothetical protein
MRENTKQKVRSLARRRWGSSVPSLAWNFFDRTQPVLPTGSIELQTHGSEVRFCNIYVRDIPEAEGKALQATITGAAK